MGLVMCACTISVCSFAYWISRERYRGREREIEGEKEKERQREGKTERVLVY